ncbi:MAG: L,D-transpeptidase family protein [Hyphomicrobiales bacterium]|nr:L,D-transpeptidase family protein [Hyphomicrobiales bacterium]
MPFCLKTKRLNSASAARWIRAAVLILVMLGWIMSVPGYALEPDTETHTAALDPQEIESPVLVDDVFGEMASTLTFEKDTLLDIARAEELGLIELMVANPGVDRWYPGPNVQLTLPTAHIVPDAPRVGIIVNLAELRLYYFHPEKGAFSFPIGVGKDGFSTPLGRTKVVRKQANPTWYPTKEKLKEDPSLPAVFPPGPDNPLGEFALYLGFPQYLIHGTAKPWGIGRRVSRGCIRMYPEDIAWLFENVEVGTPVTIVEQTVKFGQRNGTLYVEVHPSLTQIDEVEETGHSSFEPVPDYTDMVLLKAEDNWSRIDWASVDRAFAERRGYPIAIMR